MSTCAALGGSLSMQLVFAGLRGRRGTLSPTFRVSAFAGSRSPFPRPPARREAWPFCGAFAALFHGSWRRATSGIAALFFAQGVEEESFPEGSTTRHRDSGAWKGNSFNKGHACIHGKGFRGTPLLHTLTKISNAHSTAKLLGHVLPAGPIAHCGSQRLKWSWGAAAGKDCRKSPYERH